MRKLFLIVACLTIAAAANMLWQLRPIAPPRWTADDANIIASLWIGNLPALAEDLSNDVADNALAARFGHALFFDTRLSANSAISCAHCHQPVRQFTDGLPKGVALGMSKRNTPSIVGVAYDAWFYWDGRKDSLWSQALSPLEDPAEHGGNRMQFARLIADDSDYRERYTALFGDLPDFSDSARFPIAAAPDINASLDAAWRGMADEDREAVNRVFVNIGKAIAAYERLLVHGPAPFDAYAEAVIEGDLEAQHSLLDSEEANGLKLFIGKARCTECHNGPRFTNGEFHNTGIIAATGEFPDRGRSDGHRLVVDDPFNCLGHYSDNPDPYCAELRFMRTGIELIGAVKTPSLRNLQNTAPYMHRGQVASLEEAIRHYDDSPLAMIGHNEAEFPLGLSRRERRQLEAFLHTLASPPAVSREWLEAPKRPAVAQD